MASVQPNEKDQRAHGLSLNLSSNNPFRNRTSTGSPTSPFDDPSPRPVSRNPFLDPSINQTQPPANKMAEKTGASSPTAEEIFDSLTLDEKKKSPPPGAMRRPPPGRENMPPPGRRGPPPNHRPTRSQEEALRARRMQGGGPSRGPIDPSQSPRRPSGRPRRNSETSVRSTDKVLTEEEKKARDARRREREKRQCEKPRPSRKMDIIDKLDATNIYGTGLFHHDGPFDALHPSRNRHGSRRAPMEAFPEGSLNNTMGGAGPLNSKPDHAQFLGQGDEEAFKDYAKGTRDMMHGDESLGLGTSTFLEGTPAARTAIQKHREEQAAEIAEGGIQRKKSLAQRIRSINRGQRGGFQSSGRMTNPDAYAPRRSPMSASLGGSGSGEANPFFEEFDVGKKGEETISVRKMDSATPSSTSPKMTLERRATTDAATGLSSSPATDEPSKPTGILGRMKSLKGPSRRRAPPPPPAAEQ